MGFIPTAPRYKHLLHTSASFAVMLLAHSQIALAAPEGGIVTSGSATIQSIGTTTTIQQSSDRAIIGWDSFDVNSAEHVQFQQPSSSSITVNRIHDTKASQINGKITANGNIILLNQNGIVFGSTSVVDVGGVVATSSDLEDDAAFMAGGAVKLTKPGKDNARIINNGTMTVRDAGLAGLVAPHVENNGVIQAKMGRVQLASGDMATIDFAGDGLIKLEVSDAVASQSIRNTGTIDAEGGSVLITAAQARGVVDALITNTGTIKANTVANKTGKVEIRAAQGKIINTGTIEAAGFNNDEAGGDIMLLADQIILDGPSVLDASGDIRGGTIRVGGDYQGGGDLPTSDYLFVGGDVILNTRSRKIGPAGTIILWSDDTTRFYGHADAGGDNGLIEVSGKQALDFDGTVDLRSSNGANGTLLLDPTNITISSGANSNVTGSTPYTPSADSVTSVLNIATLQTALNNGNVVVQTRATGAQPGNITVDSAITWANGNKLTLDAHNQIIINQAISGNNLHMIAGGDVVLASTLSGTGTLTIEQRADNITMGLGGGAGTLNLTVAEIANIQNGWGDIILGRQTSTVATTVNALTWNDNLTLRSGTGVISIAGIQTTTTDNNLTFITDGDLGIANTANLMIGNSTGTLRIQQASAGTTIGLGGGAGTINLTATEISRLTGNWANIIIGRTDGTGAVTMSTATWSDPLTILSGSGLISVTGVQTLGANNLTYRTDGDITLAAVANILNGAATLTFEQVSANTGIGLGDSMTGALNLTTTEISRLRDGWANIIFGRADSTADINVGVGTWKDHLTLLTGTGKINIGAVTTSANNLTAKTDSGDILVSSVLTKTGGATALESNTGKITLSGGAALATGSLRLVTDADIVLGADISGTGAFTVSQATANGSIGLGTGQTGTVHFDDTELTRILTGWSSRTFGRADGTADMNITTSLWGDHLTLLTGTGDVHINGVLSTLTKNLTVTTDGGDITFANALNKTSGTTRLESGSGIISLTHGASLGSGALTIITDANLLIGDDISSTGALSITQASNNVSMGLGTGQAGTVHLDSDELARMLDGWSSRTFGRTDSVADMNVIASTWTDPLNLRTGTGALNINGAIAMGDNSLAITTDSNLYLGGAITIGSNQFLTISTSDPGTTIGLGDGQAGTLHLSNAELAFMPTTSKGITIGNANGTGDMNAGARSWADALTLRTGTGSININGNQSMGSNALTLATSGDIGFNASLIGTGTLTIAPAINGTSIGIGDGQAGTMTFSNADLAKFSTGWGSVIIGTTALTGAMNVGAYNWGASLTLRTNTGAMNILGDLNMGAKSLTLTTGADLAINGALAGTGTLTISPTAATTHIGVGDGQSGVLLLSDAELNRIQTGWTSVIIGSTTIDNSMNIGARTWNNSMDFRTDIGALNINGAQNMGANNLVLRTNTDLAINYALAGTGTLSILNSGTAAANSIGIGTGQAGQIQLSNAELALFENQGWNTIAFGNASSAGALNVAAHTWASNIILRNAGSAGNLLNINGIQTMGSKDLSIFSNNDINIGHALNGTGILSIGQSAGTVSMGVGTGQTGTVAISDTELALIGSGWSELQFGTTATTTGTHLALNVGAYSWNNNVTFRSVSGAININGIQNTGARNFTITTSGNPAINAAINGTGILRIIPAAASTTLGVGGSGTVNLTAAEIANFGSGWSQLVFGREDGTGAVAIAARTWNNNVLIQSGTGVITVSGATMGTKNLILSTNGNLALAGNLTGTGQLTIKNTSGLAGIGLGAGQTGTLNLDATEIGRIIDGWAGVTIGSENSFSNINIGANAWVNPMTLITGGNVILNGIQSTTEAGGTPLVFATTGGAFINNVGSNAINPGAGRYLVYSVAQANDTLNGLVRPTIVTDKSYSNYGPAMVSETGNVYLYSGLGMKILTLKISDMDKIYGDANPVYQYSYIGGLQGSDLLNDIVLSYSMSAAGSNALDDVGTTRTINGTFSLGGGYALNLLTGTLSVEKADLIVEGDSDHRVYGTNNPALTITYSGFKNGEDESELDNLATASTVATILSDAGTYAITTSGGSDNNYNYIYTDGTLTIDKATLIATAQAASREYGDADPIFAFNYTGFKNSDAAAGIDVKAVGATNATATSGIGNYTITGSGAFDNNYVFNYVNGTLGITRATVTVSAESQSRAYGDANPALTLSYTGFKNGETNSVLTTQATATTMANELSNVGAHQITASGAVAANYLFAYNNGTLNVNKATLTVTAENGVRLYGDANPVIGVSYGGFKNGQTSAVLTTQATATSAATLTDNVGTYATTASGAAAQNYNFNYVNGTLTVNKALLTATAQNTNRLYGDANPAFAFSYSGFKNSETDSVIATKATGTTDADLLSGVGNYTITGSGAFDENYNFAYTNGTLAINRATLIATAQSTSRIYGDANPTFAFVYTGFKNNETDAVINTKAVGATDAIATSGVGTYTITGSGAADDNYTFNYVDGSLGIIQAQLAATANNDARIYGNANPAFGITYTGFKNNETDAVIATKATASTLADGHSDVGTYAITASGASDANYSFTYAPGVLTVNKATLIATAQNDSREYGADNPNAVFVYTGFKNSETDAVINTKATGTVNATTASDVGTYSITGADADDNNYTFTYVDGTLNVTKAMVTVTASNQSRAYGASNPVMAVSYSGFKNGQTNAILNTQATASTQADALSNVGTYVITADGAAATNYDFNYIDGLLTVNKAIVTVTAGNASRIYGDANPSIGTSYSGFRNNQNHTVLTALATSTSTADETSNVGTYDTTSSGAAAQNYDFNYVNGTLTIGQATLTATAGNGTREYGATNPSFSVNYAGFKNTDTILDIDTLATASSTAGATDSVGNYATRAAGALDNNYAFNYVDGILNITQAELIATAGNATRVAGTANPAFTISYTGFRNGEGIGVINTLATASTTAGLATPVGNYAITVSGALDNNYRFTYVSGNLDITASAFVPSPPVTSLPPAADINTAMPTLYQVNASPKLEDMLRKAPNNIIIVNNNQVAEQSPLGYTAMIAISESVHEYFDHSGGEDHQEDESY